MNDTIYSEEVLNIGEVVADFLPPPHQLVKRTESVKVTLELTQKTVEFFKAQAEVMHIPYEQMIKGVIDNYTMQHQVTHD